MAKDEDLDFPGPRLGWRMYNSETGNIEKLKGPSYAIFDPIPFTLTATDRDELLALAGVAHRSEISQEFTKWMQFVISSYLSSKAEYEKHEYGNIKQRLEDLKKHSQSLLGELKSMMLTWQNLDEITKDLLRDCGANLEAVRDEIAKLDPLKCALGKLETAASAGLGHLPSVVPHVWKRNPESHLAHDLAIIFRDVLSENPTKTEGGSFMQFAVKAGGIAGTVIGKDKVFDAIDKLNTENVIRTDRSIGMKGGEQIFEEIAVSFIRPFPASQTDGIQIPVDSLEKYLVVTMGYPRRQD
mgnify:CR=1 FL=1